MLCTQGRPVREIKEEHTSESGGGCGGVGSNTWRANGHPPRQRPEEESHEEHGPPRRQPRETDADSHLIGQTLRSLQRANQIAYGAQDAEPSDPRRRGRGQQRRVPASVRRAPQHVATRLNEGRVLVHSHAFDYAS